MRSRSLKPASCTGLNQRGKILSDALRRSAQRGIMRNTTQIQPAQNVGKVLQETNHTTEIGFQLSSKHQQREQLSRSEIVAGLGMKVVGQGRLAGVKSLKHGGLEGFGVRT